MSAHARASFLGSAGPLVLVRCGLCGRRNCFDRRRWLWFRIAFCRRCWQGVRFEGLLMVSRWEGERLLMENEAYGGELRALREAERVVRGTLRDYESEPQWFWPLRVRRMAADLRGPFALAEVARSRRGAETPADPEPPAVDQEPAPRRDYGLSPDEERALDYFDTLTPDLRGRVLADLEALSRHCVAGGTAAEVPTSALPAAAAIDEEGAGRA